MKALSKGKKALLITWLVVFVYGWVYYFLNDYGYPTFPAILSIFSLLFSSIGIIIFLVKYIEDNW